MKAAVYTKYGSPEVVQLTEVERPAPKDNEILIEIYATSVTSGDVRLRASDFPALFWLPARLIFGLFTPKKKILGHELSGVVVGIGKNVSKFKVGDQVIGTTTMLKTGAHAEYICLPETSKHGVVTFKPERLSFKEAACLPIGGMTALFLLEKARIKKGQNILVYGASGSVGSFAVQIASYFGATVTTVCSTSNLGMMTDLGATTIVDYKTQNYTDTTAKYDIVFDAVGKTTKADVKKVLHKNGAFVSIKMLTKEKTEHLEELCNLADTGQILPFIDRTYALQEIVSAHAYVDSGRKRGNISITIKN